MESAPDYRQDQVFAPLQASNSFAWLQHREYADEPLRNLTVQPPPLSDLIGGVQHDYHFFDETEMTKVARSMTNTLKALMDAKRS